jgi:integrase
MGRPAKNQQVDLSKPQELTVGVIERLTCPAGKSQVFLRDTKAPSLRVRVTAAGAKSFVFEAKLNRQTIRRTIGDVKSWTIDEAQREANRLRVTLDQGDDPRELERQKQAQRAARKAAAVADALTVQDVWTTYLADRKRQWGERHYRDHLQLSRAGGKVTNRGTDGRGVTIAGPLFALMGLRLAEVTPETVEAWAAKEAATRPTQGRLALRVFKAFLTWCSEQAAYKHLANPSAAKTKKSREALGEALPKRDALERGQLAAWFDAVRNLTNPTPAAYLQVLLLTGARPGEVLAMRWDDINVKWKGLTLRDKVDGSDIRVIPLTPYVSQLLAGLPRINEWVFASKRAADGRMSIPRDRLLTAGKVAGIEGLTLHGLRRSFVSLSEWLELPAGVVAQISGHKPSATVEKHYKVRPLDLLRLHHERFEAWILEQAEVPFVADVEPGKLKVVKA